MQEFSTLDDGKLQHVYDAPVAVIIPVYHGDEAALFDRALRSVEEQDYPGEVRIYIGVDGPISDSLEAVISQHRDSLLRIIRNDENMGLARTLNRLLDALESEAFVFRMDSDDHAYPYRISRQIRAMHDKPHIDILGGAINEVNRSGVVLKTIRHPKDNARISKYIARRNPLAHPTVCFRRRAIKRFRYYPETSISQDWALWFKCLHQGLTLSNIDDVLVDMTVSEKFFGRRGATRAAEEFMISMRGINRLHGVTWRMIYPVLRYLFRRFPTGLIKLVYKSGLR